MFAENGNPELSLSPRGMLGPISTSFFSSASLSAFLIPVND